MYQRQSMSDMQLQPADWRSALRRCAQEWRQMTDADKDVYHAMAFEEAALREEAAKQPFASAGGSTSLGEAAFDAAASLSRPGAKLLSLHRLLATYQRYKTSETWHEFESGLANADGALSLDALDLETPQETVSSKWTSFVAPAKPDDVFDTKLLKSVHHTACGGGHGLCAKQCHLDLASKFTHSLHRFVMNGAMIAQTQDSRQYFLGRSGDHKQSGQYYCTLITMTTDH